MTEIEMRAELERLKAEREALIASNERLGLERLGFMSDLHAERARVARLREALCIYGEHKVNCSHECITPSRSECRCGYTDALADAGGES